MHAVIMPDLENIGIAVEISLVFCIKAVIYVIHIHFRL